MVVFHTGALGDFILACPVIEGLSRLLKKKVFFCTRGHHAKLVSLKEYYDGFLASDDPVFAPFFDEELWRTSHLPDILKESDSIFVFGQKRSLEFASRIERRTGVRCFWISSFPEKNKEEPVRSYLFRQLEKYGFQVEIKPFEIKIPEPIYENVCERRKKQRPKIVIHPGSGSIRKTWPFKKWVALLDLLRSSSKECDVVVVFGPADSSIRDGFLAIKDEYNLGILTEPDLLELASEIKASDLYIGMDSGVSHLAASTGTETVAIFGPTNPVVWAPFGKKVTVVVDRWEMDDVLNFQVRPNHDDVPEKIREIVNCLFSQ